MNSIPEPKRGLVINYAYLWRREAMKGQEEGRKDRPCLVIVAVKSENGVTTVTVSPVTHVEPSHPDDGMLLPLPSKTRLGLDDEQSWIVLTEVNSFTWPGADVRPNRAGLFAYGELPKSFMDQLVDRLLTLGGPKVVNRKG